MNESDLHDLIKIGEGINLEFKRTYSSQIGREICAMANTIGGCILIGVDDTGEIFNVPNHNRLKSVLQSLARNMDPPLLLNIESIGNVLAVHVPESREKPHAVNGRFYLREGANSQQMKRDEIREFFFREGLIYFDEKVNHGYDLSRDISNEAYITFAKLAEIPASLSRKHVLANLKLIRENQMTNAGAILFSKDITHFIQSATITCVLFQGITKGKVLDRKDFTGDLYTNYQQTFTYFQSHLNSEYIIEGGPREEKLELPVESLREAVLNALAHRSYRSKANVQIYIFQDRVEIVNPGGLVAGLNLEKLGTRSMPRNPLLFGVMHRMNLVEQIGSGIQRIREAMKFHGLKEPVMEADRDWFSITFQRPSVEKGGQKRWSERVVRKGGQEEETEKDAEKKWGRRWPSVTARQLEIIELMLEQPEISRKKMVAVIGINASAIQKHIDKLKKLGVVKRVGPTRGGRWEIHDED